MICQEISINLVFLKINNLPNIYRLHRGRRNNILFRTKEIIIKKNLKIECPMWLSNPVCKVTYTIYFTCTTSVLYVVIHTQNILKYSKQFEIKAYYVRYYFSFFFFLNHIATLISVVQILFFFNAAVDLKLWLRTTCHLLPLQ